MRIFPLVLLGDDRLDLLNELCNSFVLHTVPRRRVFLDPFVFQEKVE
jgi:hypothetical protein